MAAVTTASVTTLVKVGFSRRGADALRAASPDWKSVLRTGALTPRQVRTLRAGKLDLNTLLRGGFSPAQAKMIAAPTYPRVIAAVGLSAGTHQSYVVPAAAQVGDLLLIVSQFWLVSGFPSSRVPAGWTPIQLVPANGAAYAYCSLTGQSVMMAIAKTCVSGDIGATVVLNEPDSVREGGALLVIRNSNLANVVVDQVNFGTTNQSAQPATTDAANEMVLVLAAAADAPQIAIAGGAAPVDVIADIVSAAPIRVQSELIVATGTTPALRTTSGGATRFHCAALRLKKV